MEAAGNVKRLRGKGVAVCFAEGEGRLGCDPRGIRRRFVREREGPPRFSWPRPFEAREVSRLDGTGNKASPEACQASVRVA